MLRVLPSNSVAEILNFHAWRPLVFTEADAEPPGDPTTVGRGPELVFALASPIGTPMDRFHDALVGGLMAYGYTTSWIKLSKLLSEQAKSMGMTVRQTPESARVNDLMDVGDRLCEESESASAVALLGVNEIRQQRSKYHSQSDPSEDPCSSCGHVEGELPDEKAIPRHAWVIDSVKRPAEILQLRQIYGDHLIVFGIQAQTATRRRFLDDQVRPHVVSKKERQVDELVDSLVDRDLNEQQTDFGQNILKTFPLADVFVSVDDDENELALQVTRLLDLLFGNPSYPVPTPAEFGMSLAHASAAMSPELGLKVGAAIMRETAVVSLGTNAHPKSNKSSPAYDQSSLGIRQLVLNTLEELVGELNPSAAERLAEAPDQYVNALLAGPLKSARINNLTEFQLPVHAEMSAILEAVELGRNVEGSTVYVTAYPCHGCARHLLRLNLPVRYIEPYPKSRAEAMYGQDLVEEAFRPFTGIAPRRYHQLFTTSEDRKDPDGVRKEWRVEQKTVAEPNVDMMLDQPGIALREAVAISWIPAFGGREASQASGPG